MSNEAVCTTRGYREKTNVYEIQRLFLVKGCHWGQALDLRYDASVEKRRSFEGQPAVHDTVADKSDVKITVQ
ncbi:hypothetical protein RGCCGE502_16690 [Rhizobium grahamii CCGE 502]|uniref:Uncharacterized protein n=1 Tax=Rhizobium grahamii CCGE 502 TaxID=990285 RepID=S3IDQ2_9HYPH|nr:hypothetical protein RGCCGE502_16690 [Rhizobium grahamii CCGE 502]